MHDITQKTLSGLAIISHLTLQQGRWHFQVEQRVGCAQACGQGVLIAITVAAFERSAYWLNQVTLLLAAYEQGLDDALQLWQQQWWLWHRYPLESDRKALEQGLLLQLALASLLAQQPDAPESSAGLVANLTGAAPQQALLSASIAFQGVWG